MTEAPERPTLATTYELTQSGDPQLTEVAEFVALAFEDHEPHASSPPECPSCHVAMPCAVWTEAEVDARTALVAAFRQSAVAYQNRLAEVEARVHRGATA